MALTAQSVTAQSVTTLSRAINRPSITLGAVGAAVALGVYGGAFAELLRPIGDFYIALLQICVLPFLLTTIPLAVRSAMTSGTGGRVVGRLALGSLIALILVTAAAAIVPQAIFSLLVVDDAMFARIGSFVGSSADRIDVTFALDPVRAGTGTLAAERGLIAVVPTNIFASLAGNDSMRVLVFAALFGIGMVMTEKRAEHSVFGALRHIQAVCVLIFEFFGLLVPLGIIALIAPQVAQLGPDVFAMLAVFAYAFLAVCLVVLACALAAVTIALRLPLRIVLAGLLKPMMLGGATRNTLICIPLAMETLRDDLRASREPCELFIPVGFATLRFGTILYFIIATLFMGTLMGRGVGPVDLILIAVLSVAASFATLGVTGLAALAPLAAVLRPFGLSYELAVPLMIIIDPIANMLRVMVNVAVNCAIPVAVGGRTAPLAAPAE